MQIWIQGETEMDCFLRKCCEDHGMTVSMPNDCDLAVLRFPYALMTQELIDSFSGGQKIVCGLLPEETESILREKKCALLYPLKNEQYLTENARLTAEGAVWAAMNKMSIALCDAKCLVIGYGRIGKCLANITKGFGMNTIAYDPYFTKNGENDTVESVDLNTLYKESDFIFLTVLLNTQTEHMINKTSISKMKKNVLLVNISRGGLINTKDLIEAIKEKKFFGVGLDVYEGEEDVIYTNHEDEILDIPYIDELTSLPNVLVTPHQAFLTDVALEQISLSVCNTLTLYNNKEEIDEKCIVK